MRQIVFYLIAFSSVVALAALVLFWPRRMEVSRIAKRRSDSPYTY